MGPTLPSALGLHVRFRQVQTGPGGQSVGQAAQFCLAKTIAISGSIDRR